MNKISKILKSILSRRFKTAPLLMSGAGIPLRRALLCSILLLCLFQACAFADIKIKLFAVNPSEDQKERVPISFDLPKEILAEDVVNSGGMKVEFNSNKGVYYVSKEVELAPKESITFVLTVRDKWVITEEEIQELRDKLNEKLILLEDSEDYKTAELLAGRFNSKIDNVLESQEAAAENIMNKIEAYRVNRQMFDQLAEDISRMEYLSRDEQSVLEVEFETVTFIIEADNPLDEPTETTVSHPLPKGVLPEHIIDKAGFKVEYDNETEQFFLVREEKFKANETKHYEIVLKDIWRVNESILGVYQEEAERLNNKLVETKFREMATSLYDKIVAEVEEIIISQSEVETLNARIALYEINKRKEENIKDNLRRMKDMLVDIAQQVSLKQESKTEVSNVLRQINALKQLRVLSDAMFKKRMSKVMIWKVILYLAVFISIFGTFFGLIWFLRLKKEDARKFTEIKKPPPPEEKKAE